jgi:putative endonuclease
MTDARRALGAQGEARAAAYLAGLGYRILGRNVRAGGVELDLVALQGRTVVFVEVKTRSSGRHGSPVLAVDARKQARIARGAAAWLRANSPRSVRSVRFDVIACVRAPAEPAEPDGWLLEHWQGAFDAP